MATLTTLEILKRGRERVAAGWCQRAMGGAERGAYCLVGSFLDADELPFGRCLKAVSLELPEGFQDPLKWNDAPGRTQAEVVALFDRAIARLEAEEVRS